jgi:hypothetical protein
MNWAPDFVNSDGFLVVYDVFVNIARLFKCLIEPNLNFLYKLKNNIFLLFWTDSHRIC